jgi:hypothetical protein
MRMEFVIEEGIEADATANRLKSYQNYQNCAVRNQLTDNGRGREGMTNAEG